MITVTTERDYNATNRWFILYNGQKIGAVDVIDQKLQSDGTIIGQYMTQHESTKVHFEKWDNVINFLVESELRRLQGKPDSYNGERVIKALSKSHTALVDACMVLYGEGEKVEAIVLYKHVTKTGLKEAKDFLDITWKIRNPSY